MTARPLPQGDTSFAGSIPELYDRLLVPLLFAPYAADLAARIAARPAARVLELAAGTGALTRELATRLPAASAIIATDLNPPMLARAARSGTTRAVEWLAADAQRLPFADASVELVACQFGVMFFPDRAGAFAEIRRVLRPGGALLFNSWDRIESNLLADIVTRALAALLPDAPPRFLARVPHGYFEADAIARDLAAGGFAAPPRIDVLAAPSRAASARDAAVAFCHGTPLRNEIEARGARRLADATDAVHAAIARRFGDGALEATMQALVVAVER